MRHYKYRFMSFLMINVGDAKQTGMLLKHKSEGLFVTLSFFLMVFFAGLVIAPQTASAIRCCGCSQGDCDASENAVDDYHESLIDRTEDEFDADLSAFQSWLINNLFTQEIVPATARMVTQLSAIAMKYTEIVGAIIDAQTQLDTQRVFRQLQYEPHRDYLPSETFCYFGTNVRSLAASEDKGRYNALALSNMSLSRQIGNLNVAGGIDPSDDYKARWDQFVVTYCDPLDNNFQDVVAKIAGGPTATNPLHIPANQPRTGLILACDHDGSGPSNATGAVDGNRFNRDINYTRLIEKPRTLEIDLSDNTLRSIVPPASALYTGLINQPGDEEDVIALSKNLYGHKVLSRGLTSLSNENIRRLYLALRSVAAKRNVAQTSFNAIVALKSAGTSHEMTGDIQRPSDMSGGTETVTLDNKQSRRFLAAIIAQLLPAEPVGTGGYIFSLIGYSPSYFSQLEILSKRIYQDPSFYANLYETPANVARKKVAMKAIELMVDRAIYESQIRREMSISVLLASKLRAMHRDANKGLARAKGQGE